MSSGQDLNPLNAPSAGELLGVDPGSVTNSARGSTLYRQRGGPRSAPPPKTRYDMLRTQLDIERESWRPHILDLKNNFLPYRTRYLDDGGDPNRGTKKMQYIIDNCPVLGIRTLAAGLMSSVTNPMRPWIRIKPKKLALLEQKGVPEWCEAVTNGVLKVFGESNYYDAMEPTYRELGTFGTCNIGGYEVPYDPRWGQQPLMNYVPRTWGEYWISQDSTYRVNVWMRVFKWTASQIVHRFVEDPYNINSPGWKNISPATRSLWLNRSDERRMEVFQVIEENRDRLPGSPFAKDKYWRSVFYERGGDPFQLLELSGYDIFPEHVARWDLNSDDAWGHSPAMDCLGDARSLQVQQRRKAQAIDKSLDPPLIGDANLKKTRVSMLPGDVTWLEGAAANSFGVKPLYEVKPDTSGALEDIKDMRGRIGGSLYTDVFQMLKSMGDELKSGITATEIQARVQERILEMGPVLTRLNNELYGKQIDQVLHIGMRRSRVAWQYMAAGKRLPKGVEMIFPPPPPAMRGEETDIEYISILAQAQRQDEINGIQKLITYVLSTAASKPDVLDKIDFDRSIDIVADRLSVPPEVVISTDQADQVRAIRAKQAAQDKAKAQALQTAQVGSQALANLGKTPLGQGTAADSLLGAQPQGNA
jgi:hypothetical protein